MTDENAALAPTPISEILGAAANTFKNPSIPVLVEDLILVHKLATEIKEKLAGKHYTVMGIFHQLLNA
jgi:nitrogen regulatory protein PII-like uncharacterized protein